MPRKVAICLYYEKPIKSGRVDTIFCDSECKDSFNSKKKENELVEIGKEDLRLEKLLNPKKSDQLITREVLIREGFEFDYDTHFIKTKIKEYIFTLCYDFGYREVKENLIQIIESYKK